MSIKLKAALVLALPLTLVTVSACGSESGHVSTRATPGKVENLEGERLDTAAKKVAESELPFSLRDSTGAGRIIDASRLEKYRVCFVRQAEKIDGLDLYVAPLTEKCPKSIG
ncbi:hypothetical protein AB0H86_02835 [Streptomyces sp. NPDC050997]|uniref:hypothetical protein n=1 Tax=Streptomyces sp. NPDC050997 TaxID=3155519 RepID=UPI0034240FAE